MKDALALAVCLGYTADVLNINLHSTFILTRAQPYVTARQAAYYLAHVEFGLSMESIAAQSGFSRSTVAHAIKAVENARESEHVDRHYQKASEELGPWVKLHNNQ